MDAAEAELQQELREMFAVDTQQQLETFFSTVERLNPRSWQQDIQEIYRAIHTIKGGAVTVAADAMLHAAIVLEDLLSDLRYLEQAPAIADGGLQQILIEAGELLISSLEITAQGAAAIDRVQPTVRRLTELRERVNELYLAEWDETKQLHQEFAEQGFELVILELEMELANLPEVGAVPSSIIDVARVTIDRLAQIGNDIELAPGWHTILENCSQIIAKPNARLWQTIWFEYFQILKVCVKQSGELTAIDTDTLARLQASTIIEPALEFDATLVQPEIELDATLVQSIDKLVLEFDETLVQSEIEFDATLVQSSEIEFDETLVQSEIEFDATLVQSSEIEFDATLVQSEIEFDATLVQSALEFNLSEEKEHPEVEKLPGLLDDFFAESSIEVETSDDAATIDRFEALTIDQLDTLDDAATIDQFELLTIAQVETSDDAATIERFEALTIDQLDTLDDAATIDQFELLTIAQVETSDDAATIERAELSQIDNEIDDASNDLPDLLDNFFIESDFQLLPLDRTPALAEDVSIDLHDLLDDFFPEEEDSISPDLEDLPNDNIQNIESDSTQLDRVTAEIRDVLDNLFGEEDLEAIPDPVSIGETSAAVENSQNSAIATTAESIAIPAIPLEKGSATEATKRSIQIPVPLDRLDKSAQQVVDTLLNARAVANVSTQLQLQLNQLTTLTKESAEYVTRLRQLQDDYALLRNLSDERDSGSNVTLERYRQGYTTINHLLENILRMSELGQEIETATFNNSSRLDALDRSILRLKNGIETSRLIPFRNLTLRAKAILRDLTNRYGKPAELVAHNDRVELDAGIVQQLEPVLLHLLRNAYDHGLESPQQRAAVGKPAQGTIKVAIDRLGNLYRLTVTDDGGGIDRERIAEIARMKGFSLQQTATNAELLAVLCQPGFSSSSTIGEVSGRGVGMDVVLTQIASIGGKLTLNTHLGRGTEFTISVPAPQLLVPCILIRVGERTVALPTDEVLETALMSSMVPEFRQDSDLRLCNWTLTASHGRVAGYDLNNYWQSSVSNADAVRQTFPDTAICMRTRQADGTPEIWSIADDLIGRSELLIDPLPSPLIPPVGLLGVSLQPDGRMISIFDPIALTTAIATAPTQTDLAQTADRSPQAPTTDRSQSTAPTLLVVDDAAMMRRRFEASLAAHGFIVHTCNDGLEALNWLQTHPQPDLMITDVEMPNMDGFTLIDRCRQSQIDLPILVVSSRLSEEWGKEARRLGATDYLNKGFSTTELLQKVNSLLELITN
jgi:chemotaxis protein histidine kinase CheA